MHKRPVASGNEIFSQNIEICQILSGCYLLYILYCTVYIFYCTEQYSTVQYFPDCRGSKTCAKVAPNARIKSDKKRKVSYFSQSRIPKLPW